MHNLTINTFLIAVVVHSRYFLRGLWELKYQFAFMILMIGVWHLPQPWDLYFLAFAVIGMFCFIIYKIGRYT